MWNNTFVLVTSDNGGDCGLPDQPNVTGQPGSCNNFPLLGRKCTAFEGGTRVAAFVSGGIIPPAQRGTTANKSLMYITDWVIKTSFLLSKFVVEHSLQCVWIFCTRAHCRDGGLLNEVHACACACAAEMNLYVGQTVSDILCSRRSGSC